MRPNNIIDKQQQYSKQEASNTNTTTVVHTGPNKLDNYNEYSGCPTGGWPTEEKVQWQITADQTPNIRSNMGVARNPEARDSFTSSGTRTSVACGQPRGQRAVVGDVSASMRPCGVHASALDQTTAATRNGKQRRRCARGVHATAPARGRRPTTATPELHS